MESLSGEGVFVHMVQLSKYSLHVFHISGGVLQNWKRPYGTFGPQVAKDCEVGLLSLRERWAILYLDT